MGKAARAVATAPQPDRYKHIGVVQKEVVAREGGLRQVFHPNPAPLSELWIWVALLSLRLQISDKIRYDYKVSHTTRHMCYALP